MPRVMHTAGTSRAAYTGITHHSVFRPFHRIARVLVHPAPCSPCHITGGCDGVECRSSYHTQFLLRFHQAYGWGGVRAGQLRDRRLPEHHTQQLGKVIPYGVYDLSENEGCKRQLLTGSPRDMKTVAFAIPSQPLVGEDGIEVLPRRQRAVGSRPMAGAATPVDAACGSLPCRIWPFSSGYRFSCTTFRQGPANGTRSNIACLSHHPELARSALCESRSHHQLDRQHHNAYRPEDPG